jgi:putative ABC transport system permease protein
MRDRVGSSLVIVIGMACVTAVLISTLSVTAGMMRVFRAAGDQSRALVFSTNALDEYGVDMDRSTVATIFDAPGIARGADGAPIADAEILINAPPAEGFAQGTLDIRGIGAQGMALRPEIRIVDGRMFRGGRQELVVGEDARRVFGFQVGHKLIMPDGQWPIVGAFSGGGLLSSQMMADADTLMAATRKGGFGSVLVKLAHPADFDAFRRWLTDNPAVAVRAERQSDYYIRTGARYTFYNTLAYLVAIIMSIGALFGAVNILHSSVKSRTREIATLRAIGYDASPLAASVFIEALLLSLLGALAGSLIAWILFDGHESVFGSTIFRWSISSQLVALGVVWALALALLGSLHPALRAARLQVVDGLRE